MNGVLVWRIIHGWQVAGESSNPMPEDRDLGRLPGTGTATPPTPTIPSISIYLLPFLLFSSIIKEAVKISVEHLPSKRQCHQKIKRQKVKISKPI
jgi:hypothetical protein